MINDGQSVLIRDCRIWTNEGLREGSILIEEGKIRKISHAINRQGKDAIRARGLVALPGLIDVHVHLRGLRLSYKEDFTTGTRAAAAGGFTSVLDMPNTMPPTDSPRRLQEKMRISEKRILVNVGFHVAAVRASSQAAEMARLGAFSLKLYLPKPISPLDANNDEELLRLMKTARRDKIPISVHAEDRNLIGDPGLEVKNYIDLAKTRPAKAESSALSRILRLQKSAGSQIHFCHLTLASSLREISGLSNKKISSEVTPHHLSLSSKITARKGWKAWMVPPLRSPQLTRNLLALVAKGFASTIASDHAPHGTDEKAGPVRSCPPGIPGLETTLPVLLTLVSRRAISLRRVIAMLAANPARIFGLPSKGKLVEGADGDVTLVDLRARSKVDPGQFFSKAKYTPFEGLVTQGQVHTTIVGGRVVYREGQIIGEQGFGRVLRRTQ